MEPYGLAFPAARKIGLKFKILRGHTLPFQLYYFGYDENLQNTSIPKFVNYVITSSYINVYDQVCVYSQFELSGIICI